MQKILITGANGFLGYYLTQQLITKNYNIIATCKGPYRLPLESKNLLYETMDFTNEESIKNIFHKHQPHVVIHTGAISKPDECELNKENAFRTNVSGTIYLLNNASLFKSFFVFLSSDFVFDGKKGMYEEEDATSPVNYYGETKLLAEEEVKKYLYNWSIVRTVLVYGKTFSGRHNILTNVAQTLEKGEQLKIFNDQVRTPTYVEDLAKGIIAIVNKQVKGIYHLSGKNILTPYQMAVAVADYLHLNKLLIHKVNESDFEQPARRPSLTGFTIAKAERDLGYMPVSFE